MGSNRISALEHDQFVGIHSAPNKCDKWDNQSTTEIVEHHGNTLARKDYSKWIKYILTKKYHEKSNKSSDYIFR